MKRFAVFSLFLVLLFSLAGNAQALFSVSAAASMYSSDAGSMTGVGTKISFPLIPLINTNVVANAYSGNSGGVSYTLVPVNLNIEQGIPLTPCYVGGGVGTVAFNAAGVTVASPLTYNLYAGIKKDMAPLTSLYFEAGYQIINLAVTAGTLPLPTANLSGIAVNGGISFGL